MTFKLPFALCFAAGRQEPIRFGRIGLNAGSERAGSVFQVVRGWRLSVLKRSEILSLLKESRAICPNGACFSSNIALRGIKKALIGDEVGRDFELHMMMFLDRESRQFLRRYVKDHGLMMKEMDRSVIIYAP